VTPPVDGEAPERARARANVELRRYELLSFLRIPLALGVSIGVAMAIFQLPQPMGIVIGAALLPAILLALKFLRDAAWGVYAIYFVEIFRPQDQWRVLRRLSPSFTLVFLVGLIFLIQFFTVRRRRFIWTPHSTAFLALFGIMGLTIFTASNTPAAYFRFLAMSTIVADFFLATNLIDTRAKLSRFVRICLCVYLALTLKGIYGFVRRGSVAFLDTAGGFLGDENDFALAILVFLPFAFFGMLLWRKRVHRIFAASAFFTLALGVVLTFSRGGTVGLIAVLLFCWWRSKRRGPILMTMVILVGFLVAVAPASYWKEVSSISNTSDGTAQVRRNYWDAGWRMYLDHPVLGVGLGNSGWSLPSYYPGRNPGRQWNRALHSTYFEVLAELGTAGALAFLAILAAIWRSLNRADRLDGLSRDETRERDFLTSSIRAGLIGYLVPAFFLSTIVYPHLYLLLALAALVSIHYRRAAPAELVTAAPSEPTPALEGLA